MQELWAMGLVLMHWSDQLRRILEEVHSDSAMAVAYSNHQGGTRSHAYQVKVNLFLSWAELHVPPLSAVHIPGIENWQADYLRRWQLYPSE